MTNKEIKDIFFTATEVFCNGIYLKSRNHDCGWDFLSFDGFDQSDDILSEKFEAEDFNENYAYHEFEGLTLGEILDAVGNTGWCFEISGVDDLK